MSLLPSGNSPAINEFFWNALDLSGGGGGVQSLLGNGFGSVPTVVSEPALVGNSNLTVTSSTSNITFTPTGLMEGLRGTAVGSVQTSTAAPLIAGVSGISVFTSTGGIVVTYTGAPAVETIVAQTSGQMYWTSNSLIPNSSNAGKLELTFTGVASSVSGGHALLPPAIVTGIASGNYNILRIDGTLPLYEDQTDTETAPGQYHQTTLTAAGLDVSANLCFPATQYHAVINASGTGLTGDAGLLGQSTFGHTFSLVLAKANSNFTTATSLLKFQLATSSSSNAKFYIAANGQGLINNNSPLVFTLSP